MIGAIVDGHALLQVIWASFAAGIGVTAAYGLAILGANRAVERGRAGQTPTAVAFGALCAIAVVAVVGAIVFGIVVLVNK
jgi:hypothetical protein